MSISRNSKKKSFGHKSRQALGKAGEKAALHFLQNKGMQLIEKNFRVKEGEIDLIMKDGDDICFIEVRTRKESNYGHPLETITGPKQRQVKRVAIRYIHDNELDNIPIRFDAVGVVLSDTGFEVTHIPGAFLAE